jgi:hypothetical protein
LINTYQILRIHLIEKIVRCDPLERVMKMMTLRIDGKDPQIVSVYISGRTNSNMIYDTYAHVQREQNL